MKRIPKKAGGKYASWGSKYAMQKNAKKCKKNAKKMQKMQVYLKSLFRASEKISLGKKSHGRKMSFFGRQKKAFFWGPKPIFLKCMTPKFFPSSINMQKNFKKKCKKAKSRNMQKYAIYATCIFSPPCPNPIP